MLDGLKRPDGVAEGYPLPGVLQRHVQGLLGQPHHLGAAGDISFLQHRLDMRPAAAYFTENVAAGDAHVVAGDPAQLLAGYCPEGLDVKPHHVDVHDDQGNALPVLG